jgi:hypothetical protein
MSKSDICRYCLEKCRHLINVRSPLSVLEQVVDKGDCSVKLRATELLMNAGAQLNLETICGIAHCVGSEACHCDESILELLAIGGSEVVPM